MAWNRGRNSTKSPAEREREERNSVRKKGKNKSHILGGPAESGSSGGWGPHNKKHNPAEGEGPGEGVQDTHTHARKHTQKTHTHMVTNCFS